MKSAGGCLAIILAAVVLSLPSGISAHGDEHEAVDQSSQEGGSQVPSYFRYPDHRAMIYFHIVLMTVAWVFMLPSAVMLSFARSRYTAGANLVFIATHAAGLATGIVYNTSTPDLYPNNAHHKLGWIATVIVTIQVCIGAISSLGRFIGSRAGRQRPLGAESGFIPVSAAAMAEHEHLHKNYHSSPYRLSNDSGQGTEPLSQSSRSPSSRGSQETSASLPRRSMAPRDYDEDDDEEDLDLHELTLPREPRQPALTRLLGSLYNMVPVKAWRFVMPIHNVVNRVILIFGSIVLATGIATFGRFFEGDAIFSGLAHWIKGGIFFFYGLFAMGRWAGSFADIGWAWNLRPIATGKDANKWYPSAEFVESALIFAYGSSNIFLEHLSNWGGEWSAEDFEHISITVLFIGGGLCGMLVESSRIRRLLNTPVEVSESLPDDEETAKHSSPLTPAVSLNPLPALVVFLVGLMMSSHTQNTALGSMIHKQWGHLLAAGSLARVLTYLLLYLRPPTSCYPSRPPTEILAAFGLIAGGLVFAASASDIVGAMVAANVDEMALYTCILGAVGVLMAWVVLLVAMKGWAVRKEMNRSL